MLPRILEPEVMDTAEEAADYDAMDHGEVNARFSADLLEALAGAGISLDSAEILDVGTGTALIPTSLAAHAPGLRIVAVDMAEHMLDLAKRNVHGAGIGDRVRVVRADAKALPFADGAFVAAASNSLVHHIPEPGAAFAEMWRVTAPGGLLFVRDLARPATDDEVERLVLTYGGPAPTDEPARGRHARQTALLRASLHAALTIDEVASLIGPLGIDSKSVRLTSDRHWTLSARRP